MKDAVAVEVRQCWLNLRKSREKIPVGRASVAQAEENLRVTTERFKEGVALNADVLDAEVTLLQARTNLTQSLVDMELARARLEKARGR
jgi:outer membrane protein TolC